MENIIKRRKYVLNKQFLFNIIVYFVIKNIAFCGGMC